MKKTVEQIDYSKIVSSDDIIEIEDKIKGVVVLLDGLMIADSTGQHKYSEKAYDCLIDSLEIAIKGLEKTKESVEYIENIGINLQTK